MSSDYEDRSYLSVVEASAVTGINVKSIHNMVRSGQIPAYKSAGGQYRFRLQDLELHITRTLNNANTNECEHFAVSCLGTAQEIILGDSRNVSSVLDSSVHLAITSPPYFNAKMYSESIDGDLGNIHSLDSWLNEITKVWAEVFRALQPGRKFFLNIMNLPVRENGTYRTLNLTGRTIDACEEVGFIFKRDIVWHKTNGVRAHFGTYPYPGGILLNNMHEFILEFEKPNDKNRPKYKHVSQAQKENSKLDKEFWLSLKNSDVWLIKPEKSGGNRQHAAPFPIELPARLIRAYSYEGETVLDPFLGSGTTLMAAALHGRNGIGVEINGDFCSLANERLQDLLL